MFAKNGLASKLNHFEKGVPSLDHAVKRNIGTSLMYSRNSPTRTHMNSRDDKQARKEIISSYFDRGTSKNKINKTFQGIRDGSPIKPMSFMTSRDMGRS